MYQYEYVGIEFEQNVFRSTLNDHRQIIDAYAAQGWRFVTIIPTRTGGNGSTVAVDLVFERAIGRTLN